MAIFFGIVGHFSENNVTFMGQEYHIDLYGVPHRLEPGKELHSSGTEPEPGESKSVGAKNNASSVNSIAEK